MFVACGQTVDAAAIEAVIDGVVSVAVVWAARRAEEKVAMQK